LDCAGHGSGSWRAVIITNKSILWIEDIAREDCVGTKKSGKGRRKIGRKKRRMRSKIRHRKG